MADYDLPDDLLQLKMDFLASESEYPKNQELALAIHRHPWWATTENRHDAWMALNRAAHEALATPESQA